MIKVVSSKALVQSLKLALETDSLKSFAENLVRMDDMFGHDNTQIQIKDDIPSDPKLLAWSAHRHEGARAQDRQFYNGGLCYCASSNTWGIHS
jgi:hypothetical protein